MRRGETTLTRQPVNHFLAAPIRAQIITPSLNCQPISFFCCFYARRTSRAAPIRTLLFAPLSSCLAGAKRFSVQFCAPGFLFLPKSGNYTTVDPKQLHKSHMKFWRQAQSTDTPDQLENRMGQKTGDKLGWETSQEGEHSIPDQMGDKLGDKTRDKKKTSPGGADTASQMKDKLRDKTKTKAGRQDQRQEKDKTREAHRDRRQDRRQEKDKTSQADTASQTRWETRWETRPAASPARRTQHPSQGGHTKKALRT